MKDDAIRLQPTSRIAELDLVRAFAIIGVVTVHATSFASVEAEMADSSPALYFMYVAANIAMKFATPVFLFLSSLVLFLRYWNLPLTSETLFSFYRKRMIHIIIPYTVCSTIYYIAVAVTRTETERPASYALDYISKLATGTAYAHLYYIFIMIQFYLLFPFVLRLIRAFPRLISWGVPIGIAVQAAFYIAGQYVEIPHVGSWSLSYFSYYLLGAYVGSRYGQIKEWLWTRPRHCASRIGWPLAWALWLAAGLSHIVLWYMYRAHDVVSPQWAFYTLWSVHAYLSAIVLTQAAVVMEHRLASAWTTRWLKRLSAYSFGIYLLHPLMLAAYRELRPSMAEAYLMHLWYAGGFLLALFGAWLIVALAMRYVPFAWVFLGRNGGERRPVEVHHIAATPQDLSR